MPSLNFPTSPTLGQQYNDWVWNGGQWDFRQTLPGGLPAGAIIQWGGSTAPPNWLLCDGSAVSRTTYASLFAAVGTSYGAGNGTTTFNLPDLRGRVPVGKNGGSFGTLGATGGAETHTLTVAQLPAVTGDFRLHGGENGSNIWQPSGVFSTSDIRSNEFRTSSAVNGGASSVGPLLRFNNGGQGQAHNNLQPYQVVNYIIKATAAVTPGESELAPRVGVLEAAQILSPNYLINGAFDIWQRGTSGFTSGYFADRWFLNGSNNGSRSTDVPNSNFTYSAAAWNTSNSWSGISQRIEGSLAKELVGKTVTVSGWFKRTGTSAGASLSVNADSANSLDNFGATTYLGFAALSSTAPANSWVFYSATFSFSFPSSVANGVQFTFKHDGPSGSNLGGLWAGLQIEVGSTAKSFRRNSPNSQGELAACQRYFQVYGGSPTNIEICHGTVSTGTNAVTYLPLIVEMRTPPTFTAGPAGDFRQHVPGVVISATTLVALNVSSTKLISINTTAGSGFTPGHNVKLQSNAATGIIQLSAEL